MNKGLFITFEGSDGSGKTTQIRLLGEKLSKAGHDLIYTREPGGTRIGEKVRELILDIEYKEMSPVAEAILYAASRAQHVSEVIRPAIEAGGTVLCDRYIDSSIAYQGYGRELGDFVSEINVLAIGGMLPNLTFLIKIDPEVSAHRMGKDGADRIESEELAYHRRVYEGYLELEKRYPERIKGIDGTGTVSEVHERVMKIIYEMPDAFTKDLR